MTFNILSWEKILDSCNIVRIKIKLLDNHVEEEYSDMYKVVDSMNKISAFPPHIVKATVIIGDMRVGSFLELIQETKDTVTFTCDIDKEYINKLEEIKSPTITYTEEGNFCIMEKTLKVVCIRYGKCEYKRYNGFDDAQHCTKEKDFKCPILNKTKG